MRIRHRLALYGVFVIGMAMLIFAILLNLLATQAAPRDQEETLVALVARTRATLAGFTTAELTNVSPVLTIDLETSLDLFVAVYRDDGSNLYTTGIVSGAAPRLPAAVTVEALETGSSTAKFGPAPGLEHRIAAAPLTLEDGTTVVVIAGQSTEFVEQQLTGPRVVIWAAAIITLVAATVAAWLVSGRALRPLRQLVATTDEVRETGDLSRRLPEVKANDEVGRLAESFNAMLADVESSQGRLTEALHGQRRFVADASHELRGPLTTIRANAGFLRDRSDIAEADRSEAMADISTQADRMSRLVDDLLYLARADSGAPPTATDVDLAAITVDAGRALERMGHHVAVDAAGPLVVSGDADALARLAWILMENGTKHGGGEVSAAATGDRESVRLVVRDNGPGFGSGGTSRVFERFYRGDPARSPAGSGLGLAIAREIVTGHRGTIAAADRPGGGAEVTVVLPAV